MSLPAGSLTGLTFTCHVADLTKEVNRRIGQISAVCSTHSGPSSHSVCCFQKAYAESKLLYGAEIWWPLISPRDRQRVTWTHQRCLRRTLGALAPTKIEFLYLEADTLPLADMAAHKLVERHERYRRLGTTTTHDPSRPIRDAVHSHVAGLPPSPDAAIANVRESMLRFATLPDFP